MFGRSRFAKVVDAQLDLFIREHHDVSRKARSGSSVQPSDRSEAEELYGDYVDAVETGTEILADMRDHYARPSTTRTVRRRVQPWGLETPACVRCEMESSDGRNGSRTTRSSATSRPPHWSGEAVRSTG